MTSGTLRGSGSGAADTGGSGHCPEIDSLRAVAMIAVVAMHCKIAPIGWTGVWLFFVISGYVVTLSILREQGQGSRKAALAGFFRRRIGRIVPVYYLYIAGGLAAALVGGQEVAWPTYAALFGFYHNIAMASGFGEIDYWPVGHLWTVAIEMQFYLIYGAVAYLTHPSVTRRLLIALVVAAPLARWITGLFLFEIDPEQAAYIIYSGTGLHFDSFAMGCLLALAQTKMPMQRMAAPLAALGGAALGLYVATYVIVNVLVRERQGIDIITDIVSGVLFGEGRRVALYTALGLACLGLLALTVARSRLVQWLTGQKVLQWIGRISYGGYIYHELGIRLAMLALVGSGADLSSQPMSIRIATFVVALGVTLLMAQASFWLFEMPAARAIRRIGRSPTTTAGTMSKRLAD